MSSCPRVNACSESNRTIFAAGKIDAAEFPLLMHIDEILTDKKPVGIPWEKFTFERGAIS